MKAGIDFGLTNVKAFWVNGADEDIFHSTSEHPRGRLAEILRRNGATELHATGNGPRDGFEEFTIIGPHPKNDPLFDEFATQARGAVWLCGSKVRWTSVRRTFVSVGTGTSYLIEDTNEETYVNPIGNAIGAGTLDAHKALFGAGPNASLDAILGDASPLPSFDLTIGEAVPALATKKDPRASLPASHFAKAARVASIYEETGYDRKWIASAVLELVTAVTRDLMLHDKIPDYARVKDVVILGGLPHRSKIVRNLLAAYLGSIGKNAIFPERGEYAGAVGALLRHE